MRGGTNRPGRESPRPSEAYEGGLQAGLGVVRAGRYLAARFLLPTVLLLGLDPLPTLGSRGARGLTLATLPRGSLFSFDPEQSLRQPDQSVLAIRGLRSAVRRDNHQPRRDVSQSHGSLRLVSMLATGTAAASELHGAVAFNLVEELLGDA